MPLRGTAGAGCQGGEVACSPLCGEMGTAPVLGLREGTDRVPWSCAWKRAGVWWGSCLPTTQGGLRPGWAAPWQGSRQLTLWVPGLGQRRLPTLASSFLTSMTLESLKPGMRSSLQMTPASSSWLQSLFPQPRCLQSPMLFSPPAQFTLSSQIRPARHQGQG